MQRGRSDVRVAEQQPCPYRAERVASVLGGGEEKEETDDVAGATARQ